MALQCYTLFILVISVRGYEILKFQENQYRQVEKDHNPYWLNIPYYLNGTQYMWNINGTEITSGQSHTPLWLMEEPPFRPWFYQFDRKYPYMEVNRPYRLSPSSYVIERWNKLNVYDTVSRNIGCYCTTAYKVLTPLAGCAVLTNRHILTTATSTELVLKKNRNVMKLDKILGFWYEMYEYKYPYNNTYYSRVTRIHYHPKYLRPEKVNISHPFPFVYDLAIWANHFSFGWYVMYCSRAAPSWFYYEHTKPYLPQKVLVVGYQYIKAHGKVPNVFIKYATRTGNYLDRCPKVEWGEYFCLGEQTETWAKYGIESGAAYHRLLAEYRPAYWQGYDGLAAMCAFSMNLRSLGIVHYFTVLNVHPVLDWMYDAFTGRQPYTWLDFRFQDTKGKAPVPKPWHAIQQKMWPKETAYDLPIPFY